MEGSKQGPELKDILVKRSGWKEFLTPTPKKILPAIIPSGILGFVFYNIAHVFMKAQVLGAFQGKLFLISLIFLFAWFMLLFFMLSCLVYTVVGADREEVMRGLWRLKLGQD